MPNSSDYGLVEKVFDILCNNMPYRKRMDFFFLYDIEYNGDEQSIDIYNSADNTLDRKPVLRLIEKKD